MNLFGTHRGAWLPVYMSLRGIVDKWRDEEIIELSDSDYRRAPLMVRKSDDT